jgi:predicted metal-binding membrane protein
MATHDLPSSPPAPANSSVPGRPGERANWQAWLPWLLCALAWALALLATRLGWRAVIDHHYLLEESGLPWPLAAAAFLAAWQVMIVAMMTPISLPQMLRALGQRGASSWRALATVALAFGAVWTAFGLLAFSGDTGIHRLVDVWPWLAAHTFVIGAVTLTLAGIFQITPWKADCLALCRDPRALFATKEPAARTALWRASLAYSLASVGSCWALMLIMFGLGVGGLGWMLALTGAMLAESATSGASDASGARRLIGLALLALAALWLAHPAWLVPSTAA